MKTICFNILNASATHLPDLHKLSDAGVGRNLMHYTPTRDTELIVCGQSQTSLPGVKVSGDGLLLNRGVSPAVLTRGLLRMFYQAGYKIEFNSFNFNVHRPRVTQQSWLSQNQHFGGLDADTSTLVGEHLLPTLVEQSERGCISILAECGVGGTTFSTFWLRLLTGLKLTPAGSTTDQHKLANKAEILRQLERRYLAGNDSEFNLDKLLGDPEYHDSIQQALCELLSRWPENMALPQFCGGMMFVAPLLACRQANKLAQAVTINTTRWVLQGDGQQILDYMQPWYRLNVHSTNFNTSKLDCLKIYERGQVVEGCGLGGCLVLAEQLGWEETDIIQALEQAVEQHLNHFEQEILA
ncbi:hypothetical protein [Shewanella benthica]|uniref:Uncharacterized protein n=1 Tax=Shewanella benthica KT99 TaxID=314608 RepID=A9D392_9GAMM|nr:hypothetical protein [Shewanella benthica]EDQ01634.1 hypothetical protein KT99_16244 [Shewanella benthica KT99]